MLCFLLKKNPQLSKKEFIKPKLFRNLTNNMANALVKLVRKKLSLACFFVLCEKME